MPREHPRVDVLQPVPQGMKAWRLPAAKRVGGAGEFVQRQQRFTQLPVQGGVEGRGSLCPGKVQHTPGIASYAVLAVAVLDALAVLHRHPVRIGGGRDVRRGFRDGQRGGPLGKGGVKPCQPRQPCLLIASFRLRVQPVPKAGTQSGDHPEPARQGGKAIPHERGLAGPSGNLHILGALPEHPEGQRQGLIPVCPLEFPFPDPLRKAGVILPARLSDGGANGIMRQCRTVRIFAKRMQT